MRKLSRTLFVPFIVFLMIFIAMELPGLQLSAEAKTTATESITLNTKSKYLYLGTKGKDSFVFRVKAADIKDVKQYQWQILKDKGDPKAISINTTTGKVTAKSVGTAYIRCSIKLKDRTLYSEEAKVVVINNITQIAISNLPENNQLSVGSKYNFNEVILNTTAGKKAKTSGITYWEIKEDTTGAETNAEDGTVLPKKEGKFSIRAISFRNETDYKAWLNNKNKKKDIITASSEWATITVISAEGIASTQEELDALLAKKNMRKITFSSKEILDIKIGEGKYPDKTLIWEAPNTNIKNYGEFGLIIINKAKETSWEEYASNNCLEINDSIIKLTVPDKTNVKSIKFGSLAGTKPYYDEYVKNIKYGRTSISNRFTINTTVSFNYAELIISGTVDKLIVAAASSYDIHGTGKLNRIELLDTADGTRIGTSIAPVMDAKADYSIALFDGAEATSLKIPIDIKVVVENFMAINTVVRFGVANYITLTYNTSTQINEYGNSDYTQTNTNSSVLKLSPIEAPVVSASAMPKGQMLYSSMLTGGFKYKTITIDGILNWEKPETIVNATGYYMWTFIPNDLDHFNVLHGYTGVVAN